MYRIVNGKKVKFTRKEVEARKKEEAAMMLEVIVCCRKKMYGELGEQLGMIFDEIKETGSLSRDGAWFKRIQAAKEMNPKGEI